MNVILPSGRTRLSPAAILGKGGEAEVYDLGNGRVCKLFKTAKHPDVSHDPELAQAAEDRLAEHQRKLPAFPSGLPDRIATPLELARARVRGPTVGYTMRKVSGRVLSRLALPAVRRDEVSGDSVVRIFVDLHHTLASLHERDVVIGDFNDLNVMVDADRAQIIDADSFQYGGFPSRVFSERFVDPLLCDPAAARPLRVRQPGPDSDWYAFTVLLLQSLLCVGPYGGVHPNEPGKPPRWRRRITVFHPDVRYPRPARPLGTLPDALLDRLHSVFVQDHRGPLPLGLLTALQFRPCSRCGLELAGVGCPVCPPGLKPAPAAAGAGTARRLSPEELSALVAAGAAPDVWLEGDELYRRGALGRERIGSVIGQTTQVFLGPRFGLGFYLVGSLLVGFVFDLARGQLRDDVALPPILGSLVSASACSSESHGFLFFTEQRQQRRIIRGLQLSRRGEISANVEVSADDADWLAGAAGACAVGDQLFVPTDEGVVRVQATKGTLHVAARFPETASHVDAGCVLSACQAGLISQRHDGAWLLQTRRTP